MKDISWLEKRKIRRRANRDLKVSGVWRVAPALEDGRHYEELDDEEKRGLPSALESGFIADEISACETLRDKALIQKKYHVWVYNNSSNRVKKKAPLMQALAMIDAEIAVYKGKIEKKSIDSRQDLLELDRRHQQYIANHEEHMVQMCINHASKIRSSYSAETWEWYEAVTKLYGEKVLLLTTAKERALAIRTRQYRRIRYYCAYVCEKRPELGPAYMRDEDLEFRGNMSLLGQYEKDLEDAIDQRDQYQQEYETVASWNERTSDSQADERG